MVRNELSRVLEAVDQTTFLHDGEVFLALLVALLLFKLLLELFRKDLAWNDLFKQVDHFVFELERHLTFQDGFRRLVDLLRAKLFDHVRVPLQLELTDQLDVLALAVVHVWVLPVQIVEDGVCSARNRLVSEREQRHEEDDDIRKEVARVERPHEDHEQDLVRF